MKVHCSPFLIFLFQSFEVIVSSRIINTASWMPNWKEDCSASLEATTVVPNIKTCQHYLEACPNCCTAGYDEKKRECHLLSRSPLSMVGYHSPLQSDCPSACGTYRKVTAVIRCPIWTQPSNGFITDPIDSLSHTYGESANFTCASGYTLEGSDTLTCLVNGSWNGVPPVCSPVPCSPVLAPDNGQVSSAKDGASHKYRETANFTCDLSYYLHGSETLTCLADASWDAVPPTCSLSRCPVDWMEYNSVCLKYIKPNRLVTWNAARQLCQADGADLMMYKDVPISHAVNIARGRGYKGDKYIALGGHNPVGPGYGLTARLLAAFIGT